MLNVCVVYVCALNDSAAMESFLGEHNEIFGEVRSLIHTSDSQNPTWLRTLVRHLVALYMKDASNYEANVLPYIESFDDAWQRGVPVGSLERLNTLAHVLPKASFTFVSQGTSKKFIARDFKEIAQSEHASRISAIRLEKPTPSAKSSQSLVNAMAKEYGLTNLVSLSIKDSLLEGNMVAKLAQGELLQSLVKRCERVNKSWMSFVPQMLPESELGNYLALQRNYSLRDEGVIALVENLPLGNLSCLNLNVVQMGDEGCKALAKYPLPNALMVSGNRSIGSEGVIALAQSQYAKNLEFLACWDVGVEVSDEAAHALATSPNLSNLKHLYMSKSSFSQEGLAMLAASSFGQSFAQT